MKPNTEQLAAEYRRRVANGEDPDEVSRDIDTDCLEFDEWCEVYYDADLPWYD